MNSVRNQTRPAIYVAKLPALILAGHMGGAIAQAPKKTAERRPVRRRALG